MATYRDITEKHIEDAINDLLKAGYPTKNASTRWDLITKSGETLPPKLVLKGASAKAGVTDSTVNKGGGWPTNDILELLGCTILAKGKSSGTSRPTSELSDSELRALAEARGTQIPRVSKVETTVRERHWAIAEYVKRMAKGNCDLCTLPAPFNVGGIPFLECHHVLPLAEGGPDKIENAVALCPNCHRKMHQIAAEADKSKLKYRIDVRD